MAGIVGPAAFTAAGGSAAGAGGFFAGAAGGAVGSAASQTVLTVGNHVAFGDPLATPKQFIVGIALGAALGGTVNGVNALKNGNTFWKGVDVTPKVQPISIHPAGLSKTEGAAIKTDAKLPSTTQTNTVSTTQANTTTEVGNKRLILENTSKNNKTLNIEIKSAHTPMCFDPYKTRVLF